MSAQKKSAKSAQALTVARHTSLADLAKQIKAEHEATVTGLRRSVEHAMTVGDLLVLAKDHPDMKHGQWVPWLEEHCAMSVRNAQRYMRVATHRTTIEAKGKSDTASLLTLRDSLNLLATPVEPAKKNRSTLPPGWERKHPVPDCTATEANHAPKQKRRTVEPAAPITFQAPGPYRGRRVFNSPDETPTPNPVRRTNENPATVEGEWWNQDLNDIAAQMAKHFTIKKIGELCAKAIDLKKAMQARAAEVAPSVTAGATP